MPSPEIDQERLLTLLALRAHYRKIVAEIRSEGAELMRGLKAGIAVEPGIITLEIAVRVEGNREIHELLLDGQPLIEG